MDSSRVALAKEIVSRASIAMENARLYTAIQDADRRKNEFLAMLAHELRNPLAPIRNAVHIMQGDDVSQPTMNWARDVIGRQADHMARLIDDLLDVSRIVQGKVVVKPEKLSLASLVERSVEASLPRVAARDQELRVELPHAACRPERRRRPAGPGAVQPDQQRVEVLGAEYAASSCALPTTTAS